MKKREIGYCELRDGAHFCALMLGENVEGVGHVAQNDDGMRVPYTASPDEIRHIAWAVALATGAERGVDARLEMGNKGVGATVTCRPSSNRRLGGAALREFEQDTARSVREHVKRAIRLAGFKAVRL